MVGAWRRLYESIAVTTTASTGQIDDFPMSWNWFKGFPANSLRNEYTEIKTDQNEFTGTGSTIRKR
jgi:hypothetical protein